MKILFIHKSMNMGGIEKSLVNLTNELSETCNVDILLLNDSFGRELFNKKVRLLESNRFFRLLNPQRTYIKSKKKLINIVKKITTILGFRKILELLIARRKAVKEKYDVAIAFHGEDYVACYQAAKKADAKKKLVFLHFDVERVRIKPRVLKLYKEFDKIICVSRGCAEAFKRKFPELSEKVEYFYNICDDKEICKKAKEMEILYPKDVINIVSVSRLSNEKAHLRSLKIFKRLYDEGFKFCWHIIGDGDTRELIEKFIQTNNMSTCVKIYGNQQNPYPYVKSADLFYSGSLHESFGISLVEAMILKIPSLTTNTISAKEIIGEYGIICENNEVGIRDSLVNLLSNKEILLKYSEKLQRYSFEKNDVVRRFKTLLN